MDGIPAAAGAVALTACFVYVLTKDDYYCLVNTKCVHQVITGVMRICLQYGVNNRGPDISNDVHQNDSSVDWSKHVDEVIHDFIQNMENVNPNGWWLRKYGSNFLKSYMELDTTNLMEIIPKVTDIKQDANNERLKSLWNSLKDIKNIRNDVFHNKTVTCSEDTLGRIVDKVKEIVDQLEGLFHISSSDVLLIREKFDNDIKEITCRQQTKQDMITCQVKNSIVQENDKIWKPMIKATMGFDKLPFVNLEISRCAAFHKTVFEVTSKHSNAGTLDGEDLETLSCTDILSMENSTCIDIIEGDPGSGKSSFVRMISYEFCKQARDSIFKNILEFSMMILINCRDKENIYCFWDYFEAKYKETAGIFPKKYVISALRDMKMMIAIDGLDEANETTKALVRDVIHLFAGSETVKFMMTTRRGFSKTVEKQLEKNAIQYRVLNIKLIKNINDQEKFINRVIKQMPEIDEKDIMKTFRDKHDELNSHFMRPIGLILFISLFGIFPEKIKNLTKELDLLGLTYEMFLRTMIERLPEAIMNPRQCSTMILKITGRNCLNWIQNNTYEIDQKNYDKLAAECYDENKNIPFDSIMSCVFLKRKCTDSTITAMHDFAHRSQQEYLASKFLTEKLHQEYSASNMSSGVEEAASGAMLEMLKMLTRERVKKQDLGR